MGFPTPKSKILFLGRKEWTETKLCFLYLCAAAGPDVIVIDQLVLVVGNVVGEGGDDGPDLHAIPPESSL